MDEIAKVQNNQGIAFSLQRAFAVVVSDGMKVSHPCIKTEVKFNIKRLLAAFDHFTFLRL